MVVEVATEDVDQGAQDEAEAEDEAHEAGVGVNTPEDASRLTHGADWTLGVFPEYLGYFQHERRILKAIGSRPRVRMMKDRAKGGHRGP